MKKTSPDALDHRKFIIVKNARQNNLKGLDIAIPQKKLTVITGVSGSGKSSLAFDTLYAEGQRRYVESLSAYIRQFMGKINKPAVDYIRGLSPAVAIQQKVNTNNPRSTVGTATEVYDYLRLLYARIGKTFSPVSGRQVTRDTVDSVTARLNELPQGTRLMILAPIIRNKERTWTDELNIILQKGFNRLLFNGEVVKIEDLQAFMQGGAEWAPEMNLTAKKTEKLLDSSLLLIDRLSVNAEDEDNVSRMADSIQTAFYEGAGNCHIEEILPEGARRRHVFNDRYELDDIVFEEPSVNLFTFNNPYGACKSCEGFGTIIGVDEDKVIPDKTRSVFDEAVACWRGESMSEYRKYFVIQAAKHNFPIHTPYAELTKAERDLLWKGTRGVDGIFDFFAYLESKSYKLHYRVIAARYKGRSKCMECEGTRLRPDAAYVKVAGTPITDLVDMQVNKLAEWFGTLEAKLDDTDKGIARRILTEINNRLAFLNNVGLGYLSLNRSARTLSGGESQRIQIVTSLGSNLTGALYILDEPSIGLHSRDTARLISVLKNLRALGNTVIVVEHDEDVIREAEEIIDIGPAAGAHGGELIFQGDSQALYKDTQSLTAAYMTGRMEVPLPARRRPATNKLLFKNCDKNNLKNIDVHIPLNTLTVIAGVSGSGKSTFVKEIVLPTMRDAVEQRNMPQVNKKVEGPFRKIKRVEYIDQDPIGKSSRSNPVTYLKAFDAIRELYSRQPAARQRGYTPAWFSFNVDGGRCDVCKGEGIQTIEMQFMADVEVICENCAGARYKADILEIKYKDKNIAEVLDMSVDEALTFFEGHDDILSGIRPLSRVGLGYITLGQPSIHLSGGEAQRIKLATFLTRTADTDPILFIFDEPTTGLHFHDIDTLMRSFQALVDHGHTVVIIEHNMDVIKCADWLIELGPEAGDAGGYLVYEGVPEGLPEVAESPTGPYLAEKLTQAATKEPTEKTAPPMAPKASKTAKPGKKKSK